MKQLLILFISCLILNPCWGGVDFDRIDDRIEVADDSTLKPLSEISMAGWIKFDTVDSTDTLFVCKDDVGDNRQLTYGLENNGVWTFRLWDSSNTLHTQTFGTIPSENTWFHFAGTYNGATQKMYIDGVERDTDEWISNLAQKVVALHIGGRFQGGTAFPFDGNMTELYIWGKALTANEIKLLFDSQVKGIGLQIQPSNLVMYLPLNDQPDGTSFDGDTAVDRSGNGNDGTGDNGGNNTGLTAKAEEVLSYP